jgi:hypothetical protein
MGYLINCAACGGPHALDSESCKARNADVPGTTPYRQAEADRMERLAIIRYDATRQKHA